MWSCPVSYSSEGDGTLLNDSHKPWVTTDRKVNTYFTRSKSKLHPLGHDNGPRGPALFANTPLLTMNDKIRIRRKFKGHFLLHSSSNIPLLILFQGIQMQPLPGDHGNFLKS